MKTKEPRNFATHPRTRRESLMLIRAAIRKNRLIASHYQATAVRGGERVICNCAIGVLFTSEQNQWIADRSLDSVGVESLIKTIGIENFTAMTGFNRAQGMSLQWENDYHDTPTSFKDGLLPSIQKILKTGSGSLSALGPEFLA